MLQCLLCVCVCVPFESVVATPLAEEMEKSLPQRELLSEEMGFRDVASMTVGELLSAGYELQWAAKEAGLDEDGFPGVFPEHQFYPSRLGFAASLGLWAEVWRDPCFCSTLSIPCVVVSFEHRGDELVFGSSKRRTWLGTRRPFVLSSWSTLLRVYSPVSWLPPACICAWMRNTLTGIPA